MPAQRVARVRFGSSSRSTPDTPQSGPVAPSATGGRSSAASQPGAPRITTPSTPSTGASGKDQEQELDSWDEELGDQGPVLALYASHNLVGAAFYDAAERKLLLLEDSPELGLAAGTTEASEDGSNESSSRTSATSEQSHELDVASMLIEQLQPQRVLMPAKSSAASFIFVTQALRQSGGSLEVRPSAEFNVEAGKTRINNLSLAAVDSMHADDDELAKALRLGSMINLAQMRLSTAAAASLLTHLTQSSSMAGPAAEDAASRMPIDSVEALALDECVCIDADARTGISVFEVEAHATLHSDKTKEGLSLYALLDQTRTPMGGHMLRRWLSLPSRSLSLLAARHDAVECLSHTSNSALLGAFRGSLKSLPPVPKLVLRLRRGDADAKVLRSLVNFCSAALAVRENVRALEYSTPVPLMERIRTAFDPQSLRKLKKRIEDTIDWDESATERRVCVKAGIDADLDRWRHTYAGLPSLLDQIASKLRERMTPRRAKMSLVYFPQLGYLHALPLAEGENAEEAGTELGWEFQFASEITSYWRSDRTRELDEYFGDLHSLIAEREIEIVHRLQEELEQCSSLLLECATLLTELDCLVAFANCAMLYGYVRPQLDHSGVIDIRQGRHPLQELCIQTFVPNDTLMAAGRGIGVGAMDLDDQESDTTGATAEAKSVVILTGANAGGKSVYLKQVALIVLMAQVGSFVPADAARIGLVDKILTRVQTHESSSRQQSSFTLDMAQVSRALRSATSKSLVLLDEMAKGTLAHDGAALFAATCIELLKRGHNCPRTLAATHFHEVFHSDLLPESLPYQPAHMEMIIEGVEARASSESIPQLTLLYKFRHGLALASHASICARVAGVPPRVVERSAYVAALAASHELARLQLEEHDDEDSETASSSASPSRSVVRVSQSALRKAEEQARRFVEWDLTTSLEQDEMGDERMLDAANNGVETLDEVRLKLAEILG